MAQGEIGLVLPPQRPQTGAHSAPARGQHGADQPPLHQVRTLNSDAKRASNGTMALGKLGMMNLL